MKIALVGAGSRGTQYCRHAVNHRDAEIVAVVDPDVRRRDFVGDAYDIPAQNRFDLVESLLESGAKFDAAINATMDAQHVKTTLPLIEAGKAVLLEKPICLNKDELFTLYHAAVKHGVKVMICHNLRYQPFYQGIKERLLAGEIGEIKHIYASETAAQSHMGAAFIRGKWGKAEECGSKIIMAKCCHDMDLITWLKSGVRPVMVASMGSLYEYRPEKARPGSGSKCLVDCTISDRCPYNAELNYIKNGAWGVYAWRDILDKGSDLFGKTIPLDEKIKYLKEGGAFGRCVYRSDNDQYDTQNVMISFEDGAQATFGLTGGAVVGDRYIRIEGTRGMIEGRYSDMKFTIRREKYDGEKPYSEETVVTEAEHGKNDTHGGGDTGLIIDFIDFISGKSPSISCTRIEDSIYGHLIGFGAILSDEEKRFVEIEHLRS